MAMNIRSKNIALLFSCVLLSISCVDKYLPDSLDAFDRDVNFTTKLYRPQLGKNTLMSDNFSSGNSTLPLTFEIFPGKSLENSIYGYRKVYRRNRS